MTSAIERGMKGVLPHEPKAPTALKAADVLRANPFKNAPRMPTGIPTIDKNTRGGLPIGAVVTLQGKPGAGKTAFAIQIATKFAREHNAVIIGFFPDEGRVRAAVRAGQNLGFDREKLEDGDEEELVRLDAALEELDFWFPDPEEAGAYIETIAQLFKQPRFAGRPLVLIVDSTQTARVRGLPEDALIQRRVGAVMDVVRRIALVTPCLVLNISQVNRASYRNKKDEDNIDPLAAGAENRAIEFNSDLLIHFAGDVEKIVSFQAPKTRLGDKFKGRLAFAKATAKLAEIDVEVEAEESDAAFQKALANAKAAILKQLKRHPAGLQAGQLRELAGGKKTIHLMARSDLLDQEKIMADMDGRYPIFKLSPGFQ